MLTLVRDIAIDANVFFAFKPLLFFECVLGDDRFNLQLSLPDKTCLFICQRSQVVSFLTHLDEASQVFFRKHHLIFRFTFALDVFQVFFHEVLLLFMHVVPQIRDHLF